MVSERLDLYKCAVQQAEAAGESSKVRRYKRSITTLEQVRVCVCVCVRMYVCVCVWPGWDIGSCLLE